MDTKHVQALTPAGPESRPVPLLAIFLLFNHVSLVSFGGGLAAWIYREVVEQRRWFTPTDFLSGLALSQVLPGINVANMAIYIGQRLRGGRGAAAGLLGLITAPFFIIIGVATVYAQIDAIPWMHNFLCGVATAAVGLVLSVSLKSIRHTIRGIGHFTILAAIVLTIGVLHWQMIPVILCAAPFSVALARFQKGDKSAR